MNSASCPTPPGSCAHRAEDAAQDAKKEVGSSAGSEWRRHLNIAFVSQARDAEKKKRRAKKMASKKKRKKRRKKKRKVPLPCVGNLLSTDLM